MAKLILKHVVLTDVLVVKSVIPLETIKQHLPKKHFHPKVGEMIVDETLARERV
jgi:hypothetical protein